MAYINNSGHQISVIAPIDMCSPGDEVFIDFISLGDT